MQWSRPDFEEIALSGEVTAYANADDGSDTVTHTPPDAATAAPLTRRDDSA